jgi:tetratricopeptide (TPR) repeat protein
MARIQRQELKHDEFVDSVDLIWAYVEENTQKVALMALAVIVAVVGIGWYVLHRQAQEEQAGLLLSEAIVAYEGQVQEGLPPLPGQEGRVFSSQEDKWKMAIEKFAAVHEQFSGTQAGEIARHYEGISRYRLGEREAAVEILEEVSLSRRREVASLAQLHLAGFYSEQGRADEAEKLYRALIAAPTTTVPKQTAQFALASLLADSRPGEARELYEQIKTEFPDTPIATTVTQRQELLPKSEPKEAATVEPAEQ